MLNNKPTHLQVNILQLTMEGHESETSFLSGASTATSPHLLCYGTSPYGGESSQHDHGGQWTPLMGGSGHLWVSIGVLHPQDTSIPGPRGTTPSC